MAKAKKSFLIRNINLLLLYALMVLIIFTYNGNGVYSKYSGVSDPEFSVKAASFYLSSDTLDASGADAVFTSGVIYINIYNFEDTNYTGYDTTYDIGISDIVTLGSEDITVIDGNNGILTADAADTALLELTLHADILSFIVTLETTNGYGKTLTASFAKQFSVTFDKQGGVNGSNGVDAAYGRAMPAATAPENPGFTFGGYYTQPGGAGIQYYDDNMESAADCDFTSNTVLYAYWI